MFLQGLEFGLGLALAAAIMLVIIVALTVLIERRDFQRKEVRQSRNIGDSLLEEMMDVNLRRGGGTVLFVRAAQWKKRSAGGNDPLDSPSRGPRSNWFS